MGNSIVYAIKIAFIVGISITFGTAIITLVSLLTTVITNTALDEIIALISLYLPFNPAQFFGSFVLLISGLISFLIAFKLYHIYLHAQASA